jgi:NAD(P) transhydrogenase
MFKRPTDPKEYNYMYLGSGSLMMGALYAAHSAAVPHIYAMGYLASSICCIGAICGLANQSTARLGNIYNRL